MPTGDREPDQLWLMLGEMRQQHKESAAERAVTRDMLEKLSQKFDALDAKFNALQEERARSAGGFAVVITIIATIGSATIAVLVEWIKTKLA